MVNKMEEENGFENVEQKVFEALDNQMRRQILRYIGEKRNATFTDIMKETKTPDSPTLSYHLRGLAPFIEQQNGKYQLTQLGKDAYNLLLKTAEYDKLVLHRGMAMTEEEHERWHSAPQEMTPKQHEALMRKMGISKEEDEKWHKIHGMPQELISSEQKKKPVNPFAIGGGFLEYCVKQGWIVQEGKGRAAKHYITEKGIKELKEFGIKI